MPLHHADEAGREVGALQRVAGVLQRRRSGTRRGGPRTGCSARAPRRRSRCSRSTASAGRSGRRRACAGSRRPGSRRRARRSRRRCAITARIFRRVRMPAYRAARGESPSTCTSKPKRVRVYRNQSTTATRTAIPAPSGSAIPPCAWIVAPGQSAGVRQRLRRREDARVEALRLPPVRLGVEDQVRQHVGGDVVEHQRRDDLVRLEERAQGRPGSAPRPHRPRSRRRPSRRSRAPSASRGRRDRARPRRR